ncbi:MAG: DUF1016 family protein [Anaerolineaceae bacterium]|nr:DUF1016 family protein [Anaerolineaceae bacterium]
MDWAAFWGALVGVILAFVALVGGFLILDEITRRKSPKKENAQPTKPEPLSEKQLETLIKEHFNELFPGWSLYATNLEADDSINPLGIRFRTRLAGEIDFLCNNEEGEFVVIELKKDKAPDKVKAQIERYINWVEQNKAQPGQKVHGIIIAKSFDTRLAYALLNQDRIQLWTYRLNIEFNQKSVTDILEANKTN